MKSRFFLAMATLSLLIAGCENKDFEEAGLLNGNVRIKATMEQKEATRSLVDDSGKFTWAEGDTISVFTSTNGNRKFGLVSGKGTAEGTFEGTLQGGETMSTCAVYPYNAGHKVSETTLTVTLPAEYGDFNTDYDPNTHAIMVAKFDAAQSQTSLSNLDFKHLGGVLRFAIDNMPVGAAQFVFTAADKDVTGTFTASLGDAEPVIKAGSSATTNNTVAIKFKPLTKATDGMIFYVPLPVGKYNGFSIAVKNEGGTQLASFTTTAKNTLNRRTLARIPKLRFSSVSGSLEGAEANVSSDTEVETALGSISSSTTDPVLDLNASSAVTTFNLPEAFTSNGTTSSELNINYSAAPSTITVTEYTQSEGTTSSNDSKGEVNITIPSATSGSAPAVTIQTPTLTAGLYAAEGGTATYGEVTATTANNTLIVGNGVTINKLTVNGGNVRVKGNATISQLVNSTGGKIYVIKEETGASVPTVDNVEIVDAAVYDLMMACANGGKHTLTADLLLNQPLVVEKDVTLDLNGHSLKANPEGFSKVLNTSDAVVLVRRGAQLTVNDSSNGNGSIDANGISSVYCAVKLTDKADDTNKAAKLVVNNGKLIGYYYGISGNGTRHNTEITINGGQVIASCTDSGAGIYHPQEGTLNVNGGKIKGFDTGIELRSGTLVMSGGTLQSLTETFTSAPNGNGTTISGAALAISQHTTDKKISVSITGGTLSGVYAFYEADLQNDNKNNISINPTSDAFFNGQVYSENCPQFISGGTFSDPSALAYLAMGAKVKVELSGDYQGPGLGIFKKGNGDSANVEIDLGGHTWTLNDNPLFGSPGTVSQYFHLEKDATVTFKNGKLIPLNNASGKMLIQNYCNLTLDGVEVIGGSKCTYVLSNNNGSCTVTNSTITAGAGMCAFDVCSFSSYEGVTVTINEGSVITGRVEFGGDNGKQNGKLIVNGGTFNGDLKVTEAYYNSADPNILIYGGTFNGTGWDTYKVTE